MIFKFIGLFNADTGELRYIGQTTRPLIERLNGHLNSIIGTKSKFNYCQNWLFKCMNNGIKVDIVLIQRLYTLQDLNAAEEYWIEFFRNQGCRLTNLKSGGKSGKHSIETRQKIAAAHKGKIISESTKEKIRKHALRQFHTQESRAKMAEIQRRIQYRKGHKKGKVVNAMR
jgi:hypothetical protein